MPTTTPAGEFGTDHAAGDIRTPVDSVRRGLAEAIRAGDVQRVGGYLFDDDTVRQLRAVGEENLVERARLLVVDALTTMAGVEHRVGRGT